MSTSKLVLILTVIGLVGFTIATNESGSSLVPVITEEFTPVSEIRSVNALNIQNIDLGKMKVSWDGPRFHGRLTANGEIYNQNALTAAHKSFSFGTLLRIRNPITNKYVSVRIKDRSPYIPGRQIDLSKAAVEEPDVINSGTKKLKVEEVILSEIDNPIITLN